MQISTQWSRVKGMMTTKAKAEPKEQECAYLICFYSFTVSSLKGSRVHVGTPFIHSSPSNRLRSAYLQVPLPLQKLPGQWQSAEQPFLGFSGHGVSAADFCLVPFFLPLCGFLLALASAEATNADEGGGAAALQVLSPPPQAQQAWLAVVPKLA